MADCYRLIALLLGRLRLSVPVAIDKFAHMSEKIFSERKSIFSDGKFKATILENCIKDTLKSIGMDEEARVLDGNDKGCKV